MAGLPSAVALEEPPTPSPSPTPIVGFIDSGMNRELPELKEHVESDPGFFADQGSADVTDERDHGTAVTERFVSQAKALGVSDFQIRMVKMESSAFIVQAIDHLISQGATIINMSIDFFLLDSGEQARYQEALRRKYNEVLFVVSAGSTRMNLFQHELHSTQQSLNNVLVVGGTAELPQGHVISTGYGSVVDLYGALKPIDGLSTTGERKRMRGVSFFLPDVTATALAISVKSGEKRPRKLISKLSKCTTTIRTTGDPKKRISLLGKPSDCITKLFPPKPAPETPK
ncbi:MAG: S8 family serine peptidase [Bacteriovoracia bacterium]